MFWAARSLDYLGGLRGLCCVDCFPDGRLLDFRERRHGHTGLGRTRCECMPEIADDERNTRHFSELEATARASRSHARDAGRGEAADGIRTPSHESRSDSAQ